MTNNKSIQQIKEEYRNLFECVRHLLSRILMDTDRDHPIECDIPIEPAYAFGLSTLEMPSVISVYQEPTEGTIWVRFRGTEDYSILEELPLDEQIQLAEGLQDNKRK